MLLGYDLGSSSVKASLVEESTKRVIAIASYPEREMSITSSQEGWAEQNPEDWWHNIKKVTEILFNKASANKKDVTAIGISYQMHGLVALDAKGQVVRPSIIWCDSRAIDIGEKAFNEIGKDRCLKTLLNSPGNFTASKLKWVKDNEPGLYAKIDKVMLPGDYINYCLTGEINTTNTGLSEGIFWDFQENKLSDVLMDYFKFPHKMIPEIVPVFSKQGTIKSEVANELGLNHNVVVSYRAGDQPNNAFSMNVLQPGEIAATAGTSGVVYGVVDQMKYDPKNRVNSFVHINHSEIEKRIGVLLCVNGTGSAYSWLRNQLASDKSYFDLEKIASDANIGSEGLSFLPFGNGAERMLGNRIIGAQYQNIQFNRHSFSHLVRACLEGIAFSLVYGINCMKELGLTPKTIKAGNDNLFQSAIFSETISTLTDSEIQLKETTGAVGAALGAGFGSGVFSNLREAFSDEHIIKTYNTNDNKKEEYKEAYEKWLTYL